MSADAFAVALTLGAAGLALWVAVRFAGVAPTRGTTILVHLGVSLVAIQVAPSALASAFELEESVPLAVAALIGVVLPAFAYAFLSALWLMRALQARIAR